MKKSVFVLLLVALAACLFVSCMTVADFNMLKVGMTKAEVLQLYGRPSSTGVSNGREYYVYNEVPKDVWSEVYVDYRIVFDSSDKVVEYGQINSYSQNTTQFVYVVN